jgi:hypothetical protein
MSYEHARDLVEQAPHVVSQAQKELKKPGSSAPRIRRTLIDVERQLGGAIAELRQQQRAVSQDELQARAIRADDQNKPRPGR